MRENDTLENRASSQTEGASLQVVLMSSRNMSSLWLPSYASGKYAFSGAEDDLSFIHFEARDGRWYACCGSNSYFFETGIDSMGKVMRNSVGKTLPLQAGMLLRICSRGQDYALYIEEETKESKWFHSFTIVHAGEITIGRDESNDIWCSNPYISRRHAVIRNRNGVWSIKDSGSTNGTYLNGRLLLNDLENGGFTKISLGDSVYIMGLRILIGANFIALNHGGNRAVIRSLHLIPARNESSTDRSLLVPQNHSDMLFNRLPRRRAALREKTITIDAPPMMMTGDKIPLILRFGGSLAMGGASAMSGHYMMLLTSVLFPFLTNRYSAKDRAEYEARRVEKYTEYLAQKDREIQSEKRLEETVLVHNYPPLSRVLNYPISGSQLWERRKTDDDYLKVRVGSGSLPLMAEIEYPGEHFEMDRDVLTDKMYALAKKETRLDQVPIMVDFIENFVCGVVGDQQPAFSFIEKLLMRLSVLFSYDELKMIFLIQQEDLQKFEFVKYLPHTWNDQKTIRFLATTASEAYQISEYLQQVIGEDLAKPRQIKDILKDRPYYIVFALDKRIFDSVEILKDIMQQEQSCGISVVTVFEDVPKESSVLLNIGSDGSNTITYLKMLEQEDEPFCVDEFDDSKAADSMRTLANTRLKVVSQAYTLPKTLTFLEMFGVGRAEHLNPLKRWSESNPMQSLATPVGIATDGTLFMLDLHQKYQGPHGLVAGMTGSGKSEFLLTYILSLAVNYHPDEVAFVLIDYKGGGLAGAFDDPRRGIHLPHLLGTITNLDGATIQRSLISIQSELKRRQRVFNEAKSDSDEGTMDIYAYQRLYRNHLVDQPMPHLFIISDEFAELKQQEPEFMDQLMSIARIGRSLGVHLILATQKPAGIVNDQIRSNSKFRVCLKVQEKADSVDMLKRPEAAELTDTGRFYLQVGYNEFFAMGQSAWSGAPYEPQDEVSVRRDDSVQFVDAVGQVMLAVRPEREKPPAQGSQLLSVVKLLSKTADEVGLPKRSLWQPALEANLDLDALQETDEDIPGIRIPVGMVDDPERQKQFPMNIDVLHCKHLLIVGDAGSGKSMLLQTIMMSLGRRYTPEQVQFYVIDGSGRILNSFKELPHCGAVVGPENEEEFGSAFQLLEGIIQERRKLFQEIEADSYETASRDYPLPLIVMIIDNYAGMTATKTGSSYSSGLHELLKKGHDVGVRFMITAGHYNEVPLRVRQELGDRICLHQKDRYDYSEVLGVRCTYLPPEVPGRGLCCVNGVPLEVQFAIFDAKHEGKERSRNLKAELQRLKETYRTFQVAKRPYHPENDESYEAFCSRFSEGRFPLGTSLQNFKPIALPLRQFSMLSLFFGDPKGKRPVLSNLLFAGKRENMRINVVLRKNDTLFSEEETDAFPDVEVVPQEEERIAALLLEIVQDMIARQELLKTYCEAHEIPLTDPNLAGRTFDYMHRSTTAKLIVIESFADLCDTAGENGALFLSKIFEMSRLLNVYIIGCFDADQMLQAVGAEAFKSFNPDGLVMLFGGHFELQHLCQLPTQVVNAGASFAYDRCIMQYRQKLYALQIPLDSPEQNDEHPDEKSIFEE